MMKQETPRVRKVNISASQVAVIVDQFLSANNFSQTRATFRMEASSLFGGSPLNQVYKSSLNLGNILEDYISLKRQNLILYQESVTMMQEKYRVQKLVEDMQNAINAYHAFQEPIPVNFPLTNKPTSGVCTGTTASMQNSNTCKEESQSKKRKNSEAINEPTVTKRPRGRPPSKKNQVKGLNTIPLSGTQSLVAGSQVLTNSSVSETHPGITIQSFQSVTTCNEEVVPCCQKAQAVISNKAVVDLEKEITYEDSLRMKSDYNASHHVLELKNSTLNEVSIPHKETPKDQSHMDLSHINFSDIDMEYWSNFSLKDIGIFNEGFFDTSSFNSF